MGVHTIRDIYRMLDYRNPVDVRQKAVALARKCDDI